MSAPAPSSLLGGPGIAAIGIGAENIGGDDGIGIGAANIGAAIGGGGAIDEGMGSGIEAGSGSASGGDEPPNGAAATTPIGGESDTPDASVALGGDTDGDGTVRGATDGGAGGAIEGARGAIGAWLARGAMDAGRAPDTGASGAGGSVMRRVPGATLTGAGLSFTALTGAAAASRSFVSAASASAMSGGRPWAVAASS